MNWYRLVKIADMDYLDIGHDLQNPNPAVLWFIGSDLKLVTWGTMSDSSHGGFEEMRSYSGEIFASGRYDPAFNTVSMSLGFRHNNPARLAFVKKKIMNILFKHFDTSDIKVFH